MFGIIQNWVSKSKAAWWARQEALWRQEYAPSLASLRRQQEEVARALDDVKVRAAAVRDDQRELEALEHRVHDRREDLAHVNEELKTQIRLIEAKARPDELWVTAFTAGFTKAWETMSPLLARGLLNAEEAIRTNATDAVLKNLESVITSRIAQAGLLHLQPMNLVLAKRKELQESLSMASTQEDRQRFQHYLDALGWMTNGSP